MKTKVMFALSLFINMSSPTSFASLTTTSDDKASLQKQLCQTVQARDLNTVEESLQAAASLGDVDSKPLTIVHDLVNEQNTHNSNTSKKRALMLTQVLSAKEQYQADAQLFSVAYNGNSKEAKRLLQAGANQDARDPSGWRPLHVAAYNGRVAIVELLLEADADKNATNQDGETPLHGAAQANSMAIDELLLKEDGDTEAVDCHDYTAPYMVQEMGRIETAALLLKAKADIRIVDKYGYTPLHWAAKKGRKAVVTMLLRADADKEACNQENETPLHLAARSGHGAIVETLLIAGTNKEAITKKGLTPLCLAFQARTSGKKRQAVIHMLLLMERGHADHFSVETEKLLQLWKCDTVSFERILKKSKELVKGYAYYQDLVTLLENCGIPVVLVNLMLEYYMWSPEILISLFKKAKSSLVAQPCATKGLS